MAMNVLEMCCSWGMQLTVEISRPIRLPISEPITHPASSLSAWLVRCFPTCHLPCLWKNSESSHSPSASAVLLLFLPVEALPSPLLHSTTINTALRLYCFVWSSAPLGVQAALLRSNSRDVFLLSAWPHSVQSEGKEVHKPTCLSNLVSRCFLFLF